MEKKKVKVGIYEFTGCAGDALTIIHSEDKLVDFFNSAEIVTFLMAKSDNNFDAKVDIALVEGSISTEKQIEELKKIRENAKLLVAIGSCACYGGPQAARYGTGDFEERLKMVYGDASFSSEIGKPVESKPLDDYVKVDFKVPGCPINAEQFFYVYTKLIHGIKPEIFKFPVCTECKWRENECLLLKDKLCLGPITAAGCGARCPSNNLPCVGCWGPIEEANISSEFKLLKEKGFSPEEIERKLRMFGGKAMVERFRKIWEEK